VTARTVALLVVAGLMTAASNYQQEITDWQKGRAAGLTAEGGWLSVAGLFWLEEGANTIPLPGGVSGPFTLHAGKVTVTAGGSTREVQADSPDKVQIGRVSLFVIKRGERYGIRMKDPEAETRRKFHGLEYFPVSEKWRITAKWIAEPHPIPILNILGQTEMSDCPGHAAFRVDGKEYRLYPIIEEPGAKELFYIFKDQTAGKETYPAGRFMYSEMPKDGRVVLDFNKSYSPPCAFTDFATCPLPPKENVIALRIEAGEKRYH
jgi:hypothetical protein